MIDDLQLHSRPMKVSLGQGEWGEWWPTLHRKGYAASETRHQAQRLSALCPDPCPSHTPEAKREQDKPFSLLMFICGFPPQYCKTD